VVTLLWTLILALHPRIEASQDTGPIYDPKEIIGGKSLEQWSTAFFRWAYGIPKQRNPVTDQTGKFAAENSPATLSGGWPVAGTSGLETAMLLARSSPIPGELDLAREIGTLPASQLRDAREVSWLEFSAGQKVPQRRKALFRDLDTSTTQVIDDPVLKMMERLQPHFELMKAVRFAHQGD
jgi:hypothetical protein